LTRCSLSIFSVFLLFQIEATAQNFSLNKSEFIQSYSIAEQAKDEVFPNPKAVMRKSMIIPGWGQITNKQIWKVPIVYGLLGGLTYYSITLTKDYHDYRAAYYNLTSDAGDFRFGQTPAYLANSNSGSLLNQRDFLRNRRDFIYVTIALAYILNFVDAYVFAHLRPFDVSDDLSMNRSWEPSSIDHALLGDIPAVSLKIPLTR
jgi:hypothetical protein